MTEKQGVTAMMKLLALASALLGTAIGQAAADGNSLEMFLNNQTDAILYYQSDSGVSSYPSTIPPGWTQELRARPSDGTTGNPGNITYANNQDPSQATCTMTLTFKWNWVGLSNKCDNKKFTPTTTGSCSLVEVGTCYGSDNCKCNFTLSGD
jgi:hypothetical protein